MEIQLLWLLTPALMSLKWFTHLEVLITQFAAK